MLSPHNIDLYFEKLYIHKDDLYFSLKFLLSDLYWMRFYLLVRNYYEKLKNVICCEQCIKWTLEDLRTYCQYDDSQSVQFILECLAILGVKEQKLFLKFVTGVNGLPFGGLLELNPLLTILSTKKTILMLLYLVLQLVLTAYTCQITAV